LSSAHVLLWRWRRRSVW